METRFGIKDPGIVVFANGRVGADILNLLKDFGSRVVAVVVHPPATSRCRSELLTLAARMGCEIICADDLRSEHGLMRLSSMKPCIGISAYFGYIIKPQVLATFEVGIVNLHPGYLPYNRGKHTNVWSIIEKTPAGATMHWIDDGIDTGDIISQRCVDVREYDTAETLYTRLENACIELFKGVWPTLINGTCPRIPQKIGAGSFHRAADLSRLDEIRLDNTYRASDLIDLIRARTFSGHRGSYFVSNGKKIFLTIELKPEESDDKTIIARE